MLHVTRQSCGVRLTWFQREDAVAVGAGSEGQSATLYLVAGVNLLFRGGVLCSMVCCSRGLCHIFFAAFRLLRCHVWLTAMPLLTHVACYVRSLARAGVGGQRARDGPRPRYFGLWTAFRPRYVNSVPRLRGLGVKGTSHCGSNGLPLLLPAR